MFTMTRPVQSPVDTNTSYRCSRFFLFLNIYNRGNVTKIESLRSIRIYHVKKKYITTVAIAIILVSANRTIV